MPRAASCFAGNPEPTLLLRGLAKCPAPPAASHDAADADPRTWAVSITSAAGWVWAGPGIGHAHQGRAVEVSTANLNPGEI